MYKREVKKLLSERPLPGWNFCKYFTVVEGLAFVYEALRLYEDALNLYDDLEAFQLSTCDVNDRRLMVRLLTTVQAWMSGRLPCPSLVALRRAMTVAPCSTSTRRTTA